MELPSFLEIAKIMPITASVLVIQGATLWATLKVQEREREK